MTSVRRTTAPTRRGATPARVRSTAPAARSRTRRSRGRPRRARRAIRRDRRRRRRSCGRAARALEASISRPICASMKAISPTYGSACRLRNGSGGSSGRWASYKCAHSRNGDSSRPSSHSMASRDDLVATPLALCAGNGRGSVSELRDAASLVVFESLLQPAIRFEHSGPTKAPVRIRARRAPRRAWRAPPQRRRRVVVHAVCRRKEPGEQAGVRRQRQRRDRGRAIEDDAFARQPFQRRHRHIHQAVRRQPIGPRRVERDDDDVPWGGRLPDQIATESATAAPMHTRNQTHGARRARRHGTLMKVTRCWSDRHSETVFSRNLSEPSRMSSVPLSVPVRAPAPSDTVKCQRGEIARRGRVVPSLAEGSSRIDRTKRTRPGSTVP